MDQPSRQPSSAARRTVILAVVVAGVALSVLAFRDSRERERERAEAEFIRRTGVRHALTREVLSRYEDAMLSLASQFSYRELSPEEFRGVARQLESRNAGMQALEWVPLVTSADRQKFEAFHRATQNQPSFEIRQIDAAGRPSRAADQPFYLPVTLVEPLAGNESALGYDITHARTRPWLDRARAERALTLTGQIRLVQEKSADHFGLVMIAPVFRPPRATPAGEKPADEFVGYIEAVFRTHDLLERTRTSYRDSIFEMLYLDASETDPSKRLLYFRPADDIVPAQTTPSEADFRRGVHHEQTLLIGGRDWRVVYRPRPGWIEEQYSPLAWVRLCGVLTLTGMVAGLYQLLGRRTALVENLVETRTTELAASRRELANILRALPGMAYRCRYDDELTVLFVSDGVLALTGRTADDFTSRRAHFRDLIHADDLARVRDATVSALDEYRDFEIEYRLRRADGAETWVLSRGRGVYAANGRLEAFEGLAIDISAQKKAEHERLALERKLLESQKLESLGLLAGGIAHDFNNLLTGILGHASLMRSRLPAGSPFEAPLRAMETASLRAADLCKQMLAYAGKGRFIVEPVDLGTLARGLVPLLEISLGRKARLRLALSPGLPPVLADATQLRQILMNLVINAAEAIATAGRIDDGEIVLSTELLHADQSRLNASATGAGLAAGEYVSLTISDNGCGMPADVTAKIFDPFFTTKFSGRGLGLAAVLGIVRGHHGALIVDSHPGQGSSFQLLLPAATASGPARDSRAPFVPATWTHAGRVLVIDDEETVRQFATQALTSFGLDAIVAKDGAEGLATFRVNPRAIDLVLLDLVMPGQGGEEILAGLRKIRPDVRVLLMSGYPEADLLRRLGPARGTLDFLAKPFTRGSLAEKLRGLLG